MSNAAVVAAGSAAGRDDSPPPRSPSPVAHGLFNPASRMSHQEIVAAVDALADGKVVVIQLTPQGSTQVQRWCGQLRKAGPGSCTLQVSPDYNAVVAVSQVEGEQTVTLPDDIAGCRLDWLVGVTAWSAYATRQADAKRAALERENADLRRTLARGGAGDRHVDTSVALTDCVARITAVLERKTGSDAPPAEGREIWQVSGIAEWSREFFADHGTVAALIDTLRSRLVLPHCHTSYYSQLEHRLSDLDDWAREQVQRPDVLSSRHGTALYRRVKRMSIVAASGGAVTEEQLLSAEAQVDNTVGDLDRLGAKLAAQSRPRRSVLPTKPRVGGKDMVCFWCGKAGHAAPDCRAKQRGDAQTAAGLAAKKAAGRR
eukprot:TRINITY_DN3479_c0_g1_i4.p2 TRINITY_DN3479_c0_g1~~TRINITY_DN3479_c0_g1_i4.p2  ORF type:complete len:372 (+),score=36.64 TRINITY_DN3479_c0_g1_i4:86-1201(+)